MSAENRIRLSASSADAYISSAFRDVNNSQLGEANARRNQLSQHQAHLTIIACGKSAEVIEPEFREVLPGIVARSSGEGKGGAVKVVEGVVHVGGGSNHQLELTNNVPIKSRGSTQSFVTVEGK